jgi:hypothetical protein
MLFKLTFNVTYSNGDTATVTTRPAADVAFERRFGHTVASLFKDAPLDDSVDEVAALRWIGEAFTTEQTAFLAYAAARVDVEFDAWLDTVKSIDWVFGAPVDPTRPTPSASSSARSRSSRTSRRAS